MNEQENYIIDLPKELVDQIIISILIKQLENKSNDDQNESDHRPA